jgi:hypothetical protein
MAGRNWDAYAGIKDLGQDEDLQNAPHDMVEQSTTLTV